MSALKIILVPTDFGAAANHALDYALELAERLGAKVHLLHAHPVPELPAAAASVESLLLDLRKSAELAFEKVLGERGRLGRHIGRVRIEAGDPRQAILNAAQDCGADLIVMGTHGRQGLQRMLMGSVAEMVVRTSTCPVLTVHAPSAVQ